MAATDGTSGARRRGLLSWTPPTWVAVPLYLALGVGIAVQLGDRRHPLVGVVAGLFYVSLFMTFAVARPRMTAWTDRHRFLDSLFLFPFLAFALLLLTSWPAWVCLAVTVGFGLPYIALVTVVRRRGRAT